MKERTTPAGRTRRDWLQRSAGVALLLVAAGVLPRPAQAAWQQAAFEARTLPELLRVLGASAPVESRDVVLNAPDIAENGAMVPFGFSTALPGVRRMLLLVEKNPNLLSAAFDLTDAVEANFNLQVKMGQSSRVIAVALMADGRVLFADKDVKVTLGGCG